MAIKGYRVEPDYATPPGDTLREIIEQNEMTQVDLADRLGMAEQTISKIVKGAAPITPETASKLEFVFNIDSSFWNNLETNYKEAIEEKRKQEELKKQIELIKQIPYNELVKNGAIKKEFDPQSKVESILKFFGFASFDYFEKSLEKNSLLAGAYRASTTSEINKYALMSWVRHGEIKASKIETEIFSKSLAVDSIPKLRELTNEVDPAIFIPELQKICSTFGVAVVLVPEVKGSRVCGLTRWLTPYPKAILQLSLRYKTNDSLWFTFFHELCHIIKHSKQPYYTLSKDYKTSKEEVEADAFAANTLIPKDDYSKLLLKAPYTRMIIKEFAEEVGIHPGIVVGRLQNDREIEWSQFNDLKARYEWN